MLDPPKKERENVLNSKHCAEEIQNVIITEEEVDDACSCFSVDARTIWFLIYTILNITKIGLALYLHSYMTEINQ